MFSPTKKIKRDLGYWALSHCVSRVMLSSQNALKDCEHFYPATRGKTSVLPFCVQTPELCNAVDPEVVQKTYALPARYFYLPNQFWRHKNHLTLLAALKLLHDAGDNIVVVASGNPADVRNPEYPATVLKTVTQLGLENHFRFLGMIPYGHIMPLMRGSLAVINPSLFEGWSTTVEEAKALGVPLLLSDIGVHREQAPGNTSFYEPLSPQAIASCLSTAWAKSEGHISAAQERKAIEDYRLKRLEFAGNFVQILELTLAR